MTNKILFQSSLVSGVIQTLFILTHNLPILFIFIVSCGIWGSILNHGYTNFYFKIFDRAVMVIGFIINGLYINNFMYDHPNYILTWCSMIGAVLLYFLSKFLVKLESSLAVTNIIHIIAHGFVVFLHMLLSINLHNKCDNKDYFLCYH